MKSGGPRIRVRNPLPSRAVHHATQQLAMLDQRSYSDGGPLVHDISVTVMVMSVCHGRIQVPFKNSVPDREASGLHVWGVSKMMIQNLIASPPNEIQIQQLDLIYTILWARSIFVVWFVHLSSALPEVNYYPSNNLGHHHSMPTSGSST